VDVRQPPTCHTGPHRYPHRRDDGDAARDDTCAGHRAGSGAADRHSAAGPADLHTGAKLYADIYAAPAANRHTSADSNVDAHTCPDCNGRRRGRRRQWGGRRRGW